jgi:hypothetical protein
MAAKKRHEVEEKGGRMERAIVTLVGEGQATQGFRFVASQTPEICLGCKLLKVCMGRLVPGRTYEVVEVKDKQHYCQLYEDKVRVAKVLQSSSELLLKPQHAIEGATVTFTGMECNEKCPLERLCKPEGVKKGEKIKIEKVSEDVSEIVTCHKKLRKVTAVVVEPSS